MVKGPGGSTLPLRAESGQISAWLVKVVIGLIVVGLAVFETGSVVLTRLTARDTASKAAQEAGFSYHNYKDQSQAEDEARKVAQGEGSTFVSLKIDTDRNQAVVTVSKKARTFFIDKIGFLKKYTVTTATESAPLPA